MVELNEGLSVKLAEAIAQYGPPLVDDFRRCEAVLRDLCYQYPREINILVSAVRDHVPRSLASKHNSMPLQVRLPLLAKQLQHNQGLAEDTARWAVETWTVALGIASKAELEAIRTVETKEEQPADSPAWLVSVPEPLPPAPQPIVKGISRQALVLWMLLAAALAGGGSYAYSNSVLQQQRQATDQVQAELSSTVEAQQTVIAQTQATTEAQLAAAATTEAQLAAAATTEAQLRSDIEAQQSLIAQSHGNLILHESFDSNLRNWSVGDVDNELWSGTRQITDGLYRWESQAKKGFTAWSGFTTKEVSDFYLTIEAQQISKTAEDSAYGVLFRQGTDANGNQQYYTFRIRNNQQYEMELHYQDQWQASPIGWTFSSAIRPNEANRITITGEGSHFRFYINDQFVNEITDDRLPSGRVDLMTSILVTGDSSVFEFNNFELREP